MNKIAVLQPEVPHYREEFFSRLKDKVDLLDIYVYKSKEETKKAGFSIAKEEAQYIPNVSLKGVLLYNPRFLLDKKYNTLVLMLQFSHLTSWFLLITKLLHRKKIILWGQGISVKRYLKEEKKPDWKLRLMISLADGIMFYTEKEYQIWRKIFPQKKMVALNNTLSGAKEMAEFVSENTKEKLKEKYGIKEKVILIFCARFESNYRRTDLLLDTITRLDKNKFGYIIIGEGKNKPDFTSFDNVYDFGAVYDNLVKQELFTIADAYFQPGWVGLSIVEAMAYGKPIFTFKRSEDTKQCVEYGYIEDHINGLIFQNIDSCVFRIGTITDEEIKFMGNNARSLVKNKLTPEQMVEKAVSIIV